MTIKDVIPVRLTTAAAITATTASRELPELASFDKAVLYITVTAISGTGATLTPDVQDRAPSAAYGAGWLSLGTLTGITATGSYRYALSGPFGTNTRVNFTVTGTTPSITFSAEIVGSSEESPSVFQYFPRLDPLNGSTILFQEDALSPSLGMWNDGAVATNNGSLGSATRDWEVPFGGYPSMRLDCQGNTTPNSDPGTTATTAGIVFKRRLNWLVRGVYSVECWFKFTSNNAVGSNAFFSMSLYNRDGTNAHHGRLWLDTTTGAAYVLKYLNSAGTWATALGSINLDSSTHLYDLPNGKIDKAGMWYYWRLAVDFNANAYLYAILNDQYLDLSAQALSDTASTGAQAMHFSVEYSQKTSTRRYMNIAQLIGRRWG